jgi:hypothetical protein
MKAQEDDKSGEDDWHKVKPSKKKQNKVKWSKKRQKKLTFGKIPREPASAASKSGPMDADPQGTNSGTGGGNRPTKTATMVTPPQGATKKRKSLEVVKGKKGISVLNAHSMPSQPMLKRHFFLIFF